LLRRIIKRLGRSSSTPNSSRYSCGVSPAQITRALKRLVDFHLAHRDGEALRLHVAVRPVSKPPSQSEALAFSKSTVVLLATSRPQKSAR